MRALVCEAYGPPESLALKDIDVPEVGEGQVRVAVQAAAINFPDLLVVAGQYQIKTPPPFVPGSEAAGVVDAVGAGVAQFSVGDEVIVIPMAGGAFAEYCVADQQFVVPKPKALDFVTAAGFTITYGTSYHALADGADLKEGETLLVLGAAGGVGITAVEIGKSMGAKVIAAASSDEKLEFAKQAGADELINYGTAPFKDTVKELTGGKGADVVYDPVGGELAQQALRSLAWHGRYLVIGFAAGAIPKFPANLFLLKEAKLCGVWWGTWVERHPKAHFKNTQALYQLVESRRLNPLVTEQYDLVDYKKAFATISERRAKGKVVLNLAE